MRRGLENALDQCLILLAQGQSLDTCLQRFAQYRDELEPLLLAATAIRASRARSVSPPPEALARARARFLTEAAIRREALYTERRSWTNWFRPLLSHGVMTATLTLVLLCAILGGGSIASANSLPGDPLYGVKRVSENVRLFLTLGAERRAALQQEYEAQRVAEVKKALERNRQVEVVFAGVVDSVQGNRIIVGGIAVELPPDVATGQGLGVGARVEIKAQIKPDGVVEAKTVASQGQPVESIGSPTQTTAPTLPMEKLPSHTPTTRPQPSAIARPTNTLPPRATPTKTDLPTEAATWTILATRTLANTATSTLTVAPTSSATSMPTDTATPKPTSTPVPPPRDIQVRIEGEIEEITSNHWVVGGQRITVKSSTRVNQDIAPAQVGGWAVVKAIKKPSGELQAKEITVTRGAQATPVPREFSGSIDSISADHWVVGGQRVLIVADTQIDGTPAIGAVAHVRAEQYADGRLVARRIIVDAPQVVQFEGIIQEIRDDRWVVAGQEVRIGSETKIDGNPVVGALAEVEAMVLADGSKLARRIRVQAIPTLQPTATLVIATPEPPTATATLGPQITPTDVAPTPTEPPAVATPIAPTPRP